MSVVGKSARAVGRGVKGYFSLVAGGAKGALGVESIRQTGQMAASVAGRLRMQTCPRCLEASMVVEGDVHRCSRTDICGLTGTKEEIQAFGRGTQVDPRVIALAKGFTGHFDDRARGARAISRIMWGCAAMIALYSFYWTIDGKLWTGFWTLLVSLLCAVQAVRHSYTARRLVQAAVSSPLSYLKTPSLWFL